MKAFRLSLLFLSLNQHLGLSPELLLVRASGKRSVGFLPRNLSINQHLGLSPELLHVREYNESLSALIAIPLT